MQADPENSSTHLENHLAHSIAKQRWYPGIAKTWKAPMVYLKMLWQTAPGSVVPYVYRE